MDSGLLGRIGHASDPAIQVDGLRALRRSVELNNGELLVGDLSKLFALLRLRLGDGG
eukprot:CAMPEP_0196793564 /NCGR_PEP_ID=MMETSP1104-20130614/33173_1 /TAXON_ID=33652 /ORGANISM="Cafeteria sp., Strain Caron Lab Isolate" /LENGTH=56 /DNA_ID=CAMNT_0042163935 /DNA_START=92 /DNA_END=258 /DNA_ORIENTATION=+